VAFEEIVGRQQNAIKEGRDLRYQGPQLAAKDPHAWVWNAGRDLWSKWPLPKSGTEGRDGPLRPHTPAKLGAVRDATGGKDPMAQAFNTADPTSSNPRLRTSASCTGGNSLGTLRLQPCPHAGGAERPKQRQVGLFNITGVSFVEGVEALVDAANRLAAYITEWSQQDPTVAANEDLRILVEDVNQALKRFNRS
jgi:hypothetical protein